MTFNGVKFVLRTFFYDTKGFTLLELLFVIVFLGVALVALLDMTSSSTSTVVNSQVVITATNLANEKMEQIFADKNSEGYGYIIQTNYPSEVNAEGQSGYNRYVTITDQGTYKEANVRVTHGGIPDLILTAFLTNY